MVSVNAIAFVVLKILHNSFPCKNLRLQITVDVSKITKKVQPYLTFIFTELSENLDSFV